MTEFSPGSTPVSLDKLAASHAQLLERNQELETHYLHLQRTVDDLNDVIIEQGRTIDALERKVEALMRQFGAISERHAELRSLEEDRPPHY